MGRGPRILAAVLTFVAVAGAGAGCGLPPPNRELSSRPPEGRVLPEGTVLPSCPYAAPDTIRIGLKYDVPQLGYYDAARGRWEGFDVDMAMAVADRMHKKLILVPTATNNRLPMLDPSLASSDPTQPHYDHPCVDVVFSTLTITEERKRQIDMSEPYYIARQTFLTRRGHHLSFQTMAHQRICTTRGSTPAEHIRESGLSVFLREEQLFSDCVPPLLGSSSSSQDCTARPTSLPEIDAIMGDDAILLGLLKCDPDHFWLTGTFSSPKELGYGAGVKKGRQDGLLETVNSIIHTMKENGGLRQLCTKWISSLTGLPCDRPPASPETRS